MAGAGRVEDGRGGVSPVSCPRSSNRTCRFPASGFPTGFTAQLSAAARCGRDVDAAHRHRRRHGLRRSGACRALPLCAAARGSSERARRHGFLAEMLGAKGLLTGVPHRGLRLVKGQPESRHHRLRPRQSLVRATAAEDDEVVGARDDVSTERFTPCGLTPMLQETVHVDVGQQRTRHAPNAKGNFQFDRVIEGVRGRCPSYLRRKR